MQKATMPRERAPSACSGRVRVLRIGLQQLLPLYIGVVLLLIV
jgi:hypothetical protein